MNKPARVLFISLLLVVTSFAGDKIKIDEGVAIQLVAEQQSDDPIIGIWSGAAGGHTWQTAIIKNPNRPKDGYEFVGVLLRPWPLFKRGEIHTYLNRSSARGVYEGKEKWKSLLFSEWSTARFYLRDSNLLTQVNNINFDTPLGANWDLLRQPVQRTDSSVPLKHAGNDLRTATVAAPGSRDVVQSVLFVWFDEEQPQPGTPVLEVVVTARAYEGVLNILREVRGTNTAVKSGFSVLETNYHPSTFQLGDWINQQSAPEKLGSVFYWEDEILGETSPAMDFYMTRRAYENVIALVQQHFGSPQVVREFSQPKQSRISRFLAVLGVVAQGALQGMANYYTTVQPIEEQQRLFEQVAAAQRSQAAATQQQVWELQRLNQQLDQVNKQRFLERLTRDGEQYSRMLRRYSTGYWAK